MIESEIRIEVPGKIILFGEWAVLANFPGIAVAVESMCQTRVRALNGNNQWKWITPLATAAGSHKEKSFLSEILSRLSHALSEQNFSLEIESKFDWNLNFGLGSSSALILTALKLRDHFKSPTAKNTTIDFWREARSWAREQQSGKASGLDLAAQIFGGAVHLDSETVQEIALDFPAEILFLHSGKKFDTKAALNRSPSKSALEVIGKSAQNFLLQRDWKLAIQEHFEAFRSENFVSDAVLNLKGALKAQGWEYPLKACGAGGCETIMMWAPREIQSPLFEYLNDQGWIHSRYAISKKGLCLT